jgi:hypothetical protein
MLHGIVRCLQLIDTMWIKDTFPLVEMKEWFVKNGAVEIGAAWFVSAVALAPVGN